MFFLLISGIDGSNPLDDKFGDALLTRISSSTQPDIAGLRPVGFVTDKYTSYAGV